MFSEPTRSFLKDLGAFLQVPGFMCLPTFVVIAYFGEWYAVLPFAILAAVSLGAGQLLKWFFKGNDKTVPGSSYALISLVWFVLPLMGTIPFLGVAMLVPESNAQVSLFSNFHNAFFESMSGFTGTGLTMLDDSSIIPRCLQWWRSTTEWIGGLGIIFLAVIILDTAHGSDNLYKSESMDWIRENKSSGERIRKIWWIYLSYTAFSIVAFFVAGMPFWEALNHGITGISTGGFAVTKDSFVSYSQTIKWVATGIMLLGSFSFKIHYLLLIERDFKRLFQQTQLRYFVALFSMILLLVFLVTDTTDTVDVFFQTASALGTCGFNSVDLSNWSSLVLFPLTMGMFLGGNASSTAGGLKTQRLAWLVKTMKENIRQSITPDQGNKNIKVYYNGEEVENKDVFKNIRLSAIMLFLWVFSLATGTFLLSYLLPGQHSFYEIVFEVNSALSNVGLSSGITSHEIPTGVKWVLNGLMWVGRLEITGIIIMFAFFLGKNKT